MANEPLDRLADEGPVTRPVGLCVRDVHRKATLAVQPLKLSLRAAQPRHFGEHSIMGREERLAGSNSRLMRFANLRFHLRLRGGLRRVLRLLHLASELRNAIARNTRTDGRKALLDWRDALPYYAVHGKPVAVMRSC